MKEPKLRFPEFSGNWKQINLSDITSKIGSGKTPCGGRKAYVSSGIPLIRSQNVNNNIVNFNDAVFIDKATDEAMKNSRVMTNDVLLNITGASLGRSAVYKEEESANVNQHVCIIRPVEGYNSNFLQLCLASDYGQKQIDFSQVGGGREGLNFQAIGKMSFMIPSNVEQKKIASLFTELDNLIQSAEKELEGYRELKQGMLQKMFPKNGETVPEIRFPEFTGDWEQHKLKDMCTIITKQTGFDYSATIKPSLVTTKEDDTYSFIQNKDFEGLNINLETDFYIPISVAEKYPKITLDQPSLLISISGRIGNIGLYSLDSKAFIGGAVGICKLKDIEDGKTTLYELSSPAGQMYFNSLIKASSHANITVEDIRNIEVLLPKQVEEREKINIYFENLDNLITLQQQELDGYKELKKGLLQQMLC